MKKKMSFVANWKMYKNASESFAFAQEYHDSFIRLSQSTATEIILCPSHIELALITNLFKNSPIKIGAQNCSSHETGAFTGEVSPASIANTGATYCIIGHSEHRLLYKEDNLAIGQKVDLLLKNTITPILCIGESLAAYEAKTTIEALEEQLSPIITMLIKNNHTQALYLAYEPLWSIGTGKLATPKELSHVFNWLKRYTSKANKVSWHYLYGGSVDENTIRNFNEIVELDGFLIGRASLNFQAFKKIVSYY